ncbi:alpha/beta hydrolase [Thermoflavifilum aggregans]|nr:alpha/beta hydrolase [Thermoflavifilum aggregans]
MISFRETMQKSIPALVVFMSMTFSIRAQQVIPLYDGHIPNAKPDTAVHEISTTDAHGIVRISGVTRPTLTAYLPDPARATGTAIIICPGGGYSILAIKHEGYDVAQTLQGWGIAAFVLKYRLPDDRIMVNKSIGPLQDAQRAIQLVREHAAEWHINPHQIGIMGFSAGGHLAAMAGTRFEENFIDNPAHISLRPDFMILCYPVISMTDSLTHMGSRTHLLGEHPSPEQIRAFSAEMEVTAETPPAFIMQSSADPGVKVGNSVAMYLALHQHGVPVEMHLYEKGPHGFGMHNPATPDSWMDRLRNWLISNNWLPASPR